MAKRLLDKVCVVVGAGTVGPHAGLGIGKACAMALSREGAKVFAIDRDLPAVQHTAEQIRSDGGTCVPFCADVTKSTEVSSAIKECVARFARIDALVHSVGVVTPGGILDCDEEAWAHGINVNLTSAYLTSRAVTPSMLENGGGSLVFISSLSAIRMNRSQVAYASGKAGMLALSKSIGVEFASKGVRSNCILPGVIKTPLVEHTIGQSLTSQQKAELHSARDAMSPTGEQGSAWDVANAAVYLASDASRYVNCAELRVDGGLTSVVR